MSVVVAGYAVMPPGATEGRCFDRSAPTLDAEGVPTTDGGKEVARLCYKSDSQTVISLHLDANRHPIW